MNARTTTLLIVLALALAACMVPIQAPPPRVQQPALPEQTLPIEQAPAQNKLPATNVTQPTDAQAAAMLVAQKQLVSQLMVGVPSQTQSYIETYAAIEVVRQQKAMVLPELTATVPKSREMQAMDDLLKPETLPADAMATRIALLEHYAQAVPPQVRAAIYAYIDTLQLPATTIPVRDQWYLETQDEAAREAVLQSYEDMLSPEAIMGSDNLPASQMPVRDQWYLE